MASIGDRWFTKSTGRPATCNGQGKRWQARWRDHDRRHRKRSFARKSDAKLFLQRLGSHNSHDCRNCLVPVCRHTAATEPPVELCNDHLALVLLQMGRKRPNVHPPLVYFARNGTRVEIGWSTNLKSRMSSLSLPASAVVLTLDGGPELETALHRRFEAARVKGTEWFEITPALEAFIAEQERSRLAA